MAVEQIPTVDDASIEALRLGFRGELIRPGEQEYDAARKIFNGMIDRRPALIARCAGTADVVATVNFARERNLLTAVRGGGHSVAGFSSCDGGVVIDLSRMRGVRVDPDARTARAQGGATWGDYDRETTLFGLGSPGGVVSTTGIGGLTLGGGFGLLTLKYGMACDSLIGADVVTADGRVLTVSEKQNSDLLWGLRGGGGNFGVATSLEYRLHPVDQMLMCLLLHPPEAAGELLHFYREFAADSPAGLTALAVFMTVPLEPPMPIFPPEILGKKMVGLLAAFPGSQEEGEKAVQPLRAFGTPAFELAMPMPYTMAQQIQDADAPWGSYNYWKSAYTKDFSDELIDVLVARAGTSPSHGTQVVVGRLGGAVAKVSEKESAFPLRDAGFVVQMDSVWLDSKETDANLAWAKDLSAAVQPFALDRVYVNFIGDEGADRVPKAYGPERYAKLVALKDRYDPTNFFRLNQNIAPSK
jgi:FAD/FMN-containing dehydrogenase